MTESTHDRDIGTEEDIRNLLLLAGPRQTPPADVEARVRAAVMETVAELPEPDQSEGRRRLIPRLAVAAMVLMGLLLGALLLPAGNTPVAGTIVFSSGGYSVRGSDAGTDQLAAGAIVRTSAAGRVQIDLDDHRVLRLDRNTSLTLHDRSEIWLHRGRIYLDSDGGEAITVVTPNATISDIGTQFEIAVDDELLRVAVREGSVAINVGSEALVSSALPGAGEALQIDGLELLSRNQISTIGERWAWTQSARPLFDARGQTIRDYLDWAARESGKRLRFASPLSAQQAGLRTLHATGGVDSDADTLRRILATSAFETLTGEPHEIVVALKASE